MARINYADITNPVIKPLVERIQNERSSVPNLYKMLLNSTPIAEGWLNYLTAIRQKSGLSPKIRELLIMRVAVLNEADYEFEQHLPIAIKEGCTQEQVNGLRVNDFSLFNEEE